MSTCVEDSGRSRKCTQLLVAAKEGDIPTIKWLINNRANVNTHSFFYGHTPLMEAASADHIEAAKILLDRGADIHAHSKFKDSALTLAYKKNHVQMVYFLLEAGADESELQQCLDLRSPIVNQSQQQGSTMPLITTSSTTSPRPPTTFTPQSGMGMAELQQTQATMLHQRIQELLQHNDELSQRNKNLVQQNQQLVQLIQQLRFHLNQVKF